MTREEIKNMPALVDLMLDKCVLADSRTKVCKRLKEVCNLAIKALEQEPCENCISRQEVLNEAFEVDTKEYGRIDVVGVDAIIALPPVTPQPRTGQWIVQDIHNCHTDFKCSNCGYIHNFIHLFLKPEADYTYCPRCGAKMEEE